MDTPQENPQHETPQNNGSSAQKNSWFLRHPIITILIVLFLIGSVMKLCGYEPDNAPQTKIENEVDARDKKANLPIIASTEELGQMGTKALDGQWLILVGMVDEVKAGVGGNFFVFAPKMNLTQNSREIRCTVKHDGRAKHVKVGDVITISGVNKYNKYNDFISIKDCRFHGYDNQAYNALAELTGTKQ